MADKYPQRIVSLVPSQTELLYDLGLGDRVVGITKFCVHPFEWFSSKAKVGGTRTLQISKILTLEPDLIIANKEENDRDQIEKLEKHCTVLTTDVKTLQGALDMIKEIGKITGTSKKATEITHGIEEHFKGLKQAKQPKKAAYLIWRKPYMVAGGDTFINDMLLHAGYSNVFAEQKRYPTVTNQDLVDAKPELILLSSEPFPFKEKHVDELVELCPDAKIELVDGEMYAWYGSRLLKFGKTT